MEPPVIADGAAKGQKGPPVGRDQVKLKGFKSPSTCHWPGPPLPFLSCSLAGLGPGAECCCSWCHLSLSFKAPRPKSGQDINLICLCWVLGEARGWSPPFSSPGELREPGLGCCCILGIPHALGSPRSSSDSRGGGQESLPKRWEGSARRGETPESLHPPPFPSSPSKALPRGLVTLPYIYYANPQGLS